MGEMHKARQERHKNFIGDFQRLKQQKWLLVIKVLTRRRRKLTVRDFTVPNNSKDDSVDFSSCGRMSRMHPSAGADGTMAAQRQIS